MEANITTYTAVQYLAIDIANNYGLDKDDFDERLEWFDKTIPQLSEIDLSVNKPTPKDVLTVLHQAEEPALFYAGLLAFQAHKRGEKVYYPVSFDATASGMQLLACLTGDRKAAEMCNVVKSYDKNGKVKRRDAYTVVYLAMLEVIGGSATIKRKDTKQAVMTSLYGSQQIPKEVFGEGLLLQIFYSTMKKLAPAAWELNEGFLDMWDQNAASYHWVMPDGFNVHTKVIDTVNERGHFNGAPVDVPRKVNQPMEKGRSLGANTIHSLDGMVVREMVRRCNYDRKVLTKVRQAIQWYDGTGHDGVCLSADDFMVEKLWGLYKNSGYLSARILDHLNTDNIGMVDVTEITALLDSLPPKPFELITVHDCFRVLPNYVNSLRKQYNLQLALIARSNLLSYLISQLIGEVVSIPPNDPDLWKDILETEYALS